MKHATRFFALLMLLAFATTLFATTPGHLQFKQISTGNGLPSDEVQQVFQDREGFMWFATRYGLCKYDGYDVTVYKSSFNTPDLFSGNNITCVAEDQQCNLWLGTSSGINILNKQTGEIRKGNYPGMQVGISKMMVDKANNVWVGTDVGLFRYDAVRDSMILCAGSETGNVLENTAIKALMQDAEGDIWIGTWNMGLYRYSPATGKYYKYPKMNDRNSAHVVYEDSKGNIWIGGWAQGIVKLHNPKDMQRVSWTAYRHNEGNTSSLSDNVVYAICEDLNTHTLWVGTRSGLSILQPQTNEFTNYKPSGSPYHIGCNEINSIIRDRSGNMWIGALGGGVFLVDTQKSSFDLHQFNLAHEDIPTTAVRAIHKDAYGNLWLGVGTYGLALHNQAGGDVRFFSRIPGFEDIKNMSTVYAITQRKSTNEIWIGTYDGGLYIYTPGEKVKHLTEGDADYIKHACVTGFLEDSRGNFWVGTRFGLGVKRADGSGYLFTGKTTIDWDALYLRDICQDKAGNIWLATSNAGAIKITGDVSQPESLLFEHYYPGNGTLQTTGVLCVYCTNGGDVWLGTESYGLYKYNAAINHFDNKSTLYNLPGDMVGSIEEDKQGTLWLGTNKGLVRLQPANDGGAVVRVYTSADGLQDNYFIPNSSATNGDEFFFGGYKGYNSFVPEDLNDEAPDIVFAVTDIKLFNRSLNMIDDEVRTKITAQTPTFTQSIRLPYRYNNFSIEFASLTYKNPELNKYAYRLEGFDKYWQHTDAKRHFAYYNNLKAGSYTFQLKATNENGVWSSRVKEITITILPPFWATWWAYIIYVVLLAGIVYLMFRTARHRMLLTNRIQLQELERAQVEQMNHSKLQFFTNITHELLTPLTIISAGVDELKMQAPQYANIYTTVSTNIQRLIRLMQQILEFRKAETGNLKLRVSPGDVVAFVRNEVEAFQPLIKKSKLHFSILCDPETIPGYFDSDKLDKILYNLLSNAAKYNKEGGFIQLTLTYAKENNDYILISVRDNGKGISKEKQKTLFKRFYEGDYRKFNTIGTGIGLSLTKDLVELYGGEITVESEVGQGTTFFVKLPVDRSYFQEDQIDEEVIPVQKTIFDITEEATMPEPLKVERTHSILVLEDNEELLKLMFTLLSREYNVLTATNGKEGVEILENEDVDLVVSDIMMPQMDGIEFTRYAKSKLEFSHTPIILLTAKNKEEDRAEAYECGADGFISKPFNLAVLHARIKNLLKSKERMARDFKNQLVFEAKELNYTSIDEDFMRRAIDCVNRHLDDPDFDQPQFIDEMGTSKSTLYKKLKSLTGLNTSAFIRNIRLKAAVSIMEEKRGVRVSELAYAVGFNDPKYFSSCFKKEFNMLPSEYMERFILGKKDE